MSAKPRAAACPNGGEVSALVAGLRKRMIFRQGFSAFARAAFASATAAASFLLLSGSQSLHDWGAALLLSAALALLAALFQAGLHPPTPAAAALESDRVLNLKDRLVTGLALESRPSPLDAPARLALEAIRRDLAARGPLRLPNPKPPLPLWAPLVPVVLALLGLLRPPGPAAGTPAAPSNPPLDRAVAAAAAARLAGMAAMLETAAAPQPAPAEEAPPADQALQEIANSARQAAETLAAAPDAARALAALAALGEHSAAASEARGAPSKAAGNKPDEALSAPAGASARPSAELAAALSAESAADRARMPGEASAEAPPGDEPAGQPPDRTAGQDGDSAEQPGHNSDAALRAFREDIESLKESIRSGTPPASSGALEFLIRQREAAAALARQDRHSPDETETERSFGSPAEDSTPGGDPKNGSLREQTGGVDAPETRLFGLQNEQGKTLSTLLSEAPKNEAARRQLKKLLAEARRAEAGAVTRERTPPGERRWVRRYFELILPK